MKNELLQILAEDGYILDTMLSIPNENHKKLVLFVNGSGPHTYNTKRQNVDGSIFNYFDLFAKEFTDRGIAFCRFSTRGVTDGDVPPNYSNINDTEYASYLPHNLTCDLDVIIKYLRSNGYHDKSIYLLGWSEGTIIAPLAVLNFSINIEGLLLCGYCNENLYDTLLWQLSGNSELLQYRRLFDYDKKGYISKIDFEEERNKVKPTDFPNITFEQLDIDGDGKITELDFVLKTKKHLDEMMNAIDSNDDEWLKSNRGVQLNSAWFKEHFSLEPNRKILPKLNMPIHIFSGEYDAMTPIFFTKDIGKQFDKLGKTNLTTHIFENHDHDLNYLLYIIKGKLSEGLQSIFNTVDEI